ncbi:MAG: hypothetical protein EOO53_11500 [Gammaproteobacteria bacterium]|nr:MAG: hypothetical protein EOO53_11500 [Gammaproteobacteria bacterium]
MSAELPVFSIVAMATITASLITAICSFVSLTLTKEQKISEFRQAWIDALREDLSIFFACSRAFARATEEEFIFSENSENKNRFKISSEKVSEVRYQVAEVYSRIILRLNVDEPEHEELLRLLAIAIEKQNIAIREKSNSAETMKAIQIATNYSRPLLKIEWDRVKKGEPAFRSAKTAAAGLMIFLCIALASFVIYGSFK